MFVFFLSHWDLPNQDAIYYAFDTIGKPSMIRAHHVALIMFRLLVQKLLHIESFCQGEFSKIKAKYFREIEVHFWYYWNLALEGWNSLKVISSFFDLRCEKYWILNIYEHWKLIKILFSKLNYIIKVSFTLESKTQATLVLKEVTIKCVIGFGRFVRLFWCPMEMVKREHIFNV